MTKQELREDPVLESIQKGLSFAQENSRWLVLGVVALIVVAAVGLMVLQGRKAAGQRATVELARARTQVFAGALADARSTLETLLTRDGGTSSATEARLLLGDVYLRMGLASEARDKYDAALRDIKDPMLRSGALRGLAAALEDMDVKAEASTRYEEAAGDAQNAIALNDLMNAARTAADAGDLSRAKSIYERCLTMAKEVSRARVTEIQGVLAEIEARGGGASESAAAMAP